MNWAVDYVNGKQQFRLTLLFGCRNMPDSKIPKVEAYETREVQFWKQGPTVEEPDPNRGSNQL